MINHIHDALSQVRELRNRVLENQLFRGYSAGARALGGLIALLGAFVMSSSAFPQTVQAHVFGWGIVCALAVCLNYSALALWFLRLDSEQRKLIGLKPTLDVVPPLVVGAVLTFALLLHGAPALLFGMWMCLYGLVNLSAKHSLPKAICYLGWFYIFSGLSLLLFWPEPTFTNPWPMALVFFFGELIGSTIFAEQHKERTSLNLDTEEAS